MAGITRQNLIKAAGARFYRDGFRGVGLDQIIADVGISKTAFYKHFASKEDLVAEVLLVHDRWWQETFAQKIEEKGGPTPLGQLRAVATVVGEMVASEDFRGCFFVNVAMEFPLPHDPAHQAAAANKRAIESIVRRLAEQAGARDPSAVAEELCLVMEGAYVTQQVSGNTATPDITRRLVERVLSAHFPDSGA